MDQKTPLENLAERLDELVKVYPHASNQQRKLINSLLNIGSTQIKSSNLYTFATDRISPIKDKIDTLDADNEKTTNTIKGIIGNITEHFNKYTGNLPQPPILSSDQKKKKKISKTEESDKQNKVDALTRAFKKAKEKLDNKEQGLQMSPVKERKVELEKAEPLLGQKENKKGDLISTEQNEVEHNKPKKPVANIFKNVWARVYLNVYAGDFTDESELTLKAALMEFFLPTTKRKQSWRYWLGAGSSKLSIPKAAFIILLDILFFFPRLAINVAKLFTEVLPDTIAQLFLLANRKAEEGYKKNNGLSAFGYGLGWAVTGLFGGLFKFIYLIGCCLTSPIATSIRAKNFNYKNDILSNTAFLFSHVFAPATSFACYFLILFLLANLIPGLGFVVALSTATIFSAMALYIIVDHLLSGFNRNPNGDDLFEFNVFRRREDTLRYSDRDLSDKMERFFTNTNHVTDIASHIVAPEIVKREIERTLTYEPVFKRIQEIPTSENPGNSNPKTPTHMPVPTAQNID